MIESLGQLPGGPQVDIDLFHHVDGQAYGTSLIHDRPFDGLADPPGCIGREAKPPLGVEFLHRANQSEIALLDQIK